jgi:Leucine-rich repeat (LRR) protein
LQSLLRNQDSGSGGGATSYIRRNEGLSAWPLFDLSDPKYLRILALDLSNNQLSTLPPELLQLKHLATLLLSNNQITDIDPDVIGQMTTLEVLDLSGNELRVLPASIGRLTRLRRLLLSDNALRQIPNELASCQALEELHLRNNFLDSSAFSSQFAWQSLSRLEKLDVSGNQLEALPPLNRCKNLRKLKIHDNPLYTLPSALHRGSKSAARPILDYLAALHDARPTPWGRARVMILGRHASGKTSLLRLFRPRQRPPVQRNNEPLSTDGVFITEFTGGTACLLLLLLLLLLMSKY